MEQPIILPRLTPLPVAAAIPAAETAPAERAAALSADIVSGLAAIAAAQTDQEAYGAACVLALRLPSVDQVAVLRRDERGQLALAYTPIVAPFSMAPLARALAVAQRRWPTPGQGQTAAPIEVPSDALLVRLVHREALEGVVALRGRGQRMPATSPVERLAVGALGVTLCQTLDGIACRRWLERSVPREEHEQALDVARRLIARALHDPDDGYLLPEARPGDVVQAATLARDGAPTASDGPALSERERTLLWLLASGFDNRRIARELKLADSTVRNSLSALFRKLGVRDRTQAVLVAFETGVVPRPIAPVRGALETATGVAGATAED